MKISSNLANNLIELVDELGTEDQIEALRKILKSFKGNGPKERVQAAIRAKKAELNDMAFSRQQMP